LTKKLSDKTRLLIVSKEPAVLRLLWSIEESSVWHVETAATGWEAMEQVEAGLAPHLILLDIPQGDSNNLPFLRWLRRFKSDLPVVLLCYPDDAPQGREAIREGNGEVLARPFDARQLEFVIRRHLAGGGLNDVILEGNHIEPLSQDILFVSASPIMQKLRAQAALMAKTDVPVLILGEKGAGKYTVASLIHKLSVRSGFKFFAINCSEMPEAVLEAELFGPEGRASSPLRHGGGGKLRSAEKATIFLNEITAMPGRLQAKLLDVLQREDVRGFASADAKPADVRILAASSSDIDRALAERKLREDLYYRLSAFTVNVPPLRQRKDEIAILLRYFMHKLAKYYGLPPRRFSPAIFESCQNYSWPGNLGELEAFAKRYLVAGDQSTFEGMAPPAFSALAQTTPSEESPADDDLSGQKDAKPNSLKSLIQGIKSEAEQNAIGAALKRTGWNRKAAARLLRVSYRTLLYKIDQYQMRAPEPYLSPLPNEEFSLYDEVKGNGKLS